MSGNLDVNNYVLLLVAGTIYLHAGQPESALKILHSSEHIECLALKVQVSSELYNPRYKSKIIVQPSCNESLRDENK